MFKGDYFKINGLYLFIHLLTCSQASVKLILLYMYIQRMYILMRVCMHQMQGLIEIANFGRDGKPGNIHRLRHSNYFKYFLKTLNKTFSCFTVKALPLFSCKMMGDVVLSSSRSEGEA